MAKNATSPITSHLSKLEPRFKDQNVPYGLKNTMRCFSAPANHFGGQKQKKIFKFNFLGGILWPRWPYFDTYEWQMDAKFKISAPNYPWGYTNPKNDLWRHQRSLTSDDLGWPRNGHNVSVNHGCHLATPIHVHITSKNTEVRKFQALKRYGT